MKRVAAILAVVLVAMPVAHADVAEVTQRIHRSPSLNKAFGNWIVKESLIDGYYALSARATDRPCVIAATLGSVICDKDWLKLNPLGGGVPLDQAAAADKRRALFLAVRVDQAIPVRYGAGRRPVILLTAFDCPKCRALERNLDETARQLDATIYVFPMALNLLATMPMQTATELWCRPDAEVAWHDVMLGKLRPPPVRDFETRQCGLKVAQNSVALAAAFGVKTVPTLIFESGEIVFDAASLSPSALTQLLGD